MGREQTKRIRWDKWADKKENKKKKGGEEERRKKKMEREREKKKENGVFRFSLRSTKIGLSVFVLARCKVHLRDESYACVPKSGSFVKLQEVENFPTWIISSLKAI